MPFNLSSFAKNIHSIARNQYFVVRIPQVGNDDIITAMCRTTSMPEVTHSVQEVPYRGLSMKIDDKPTFAQWTCNFLCDEAHALRNTFLKWQSLQYNVQTLTNLPHNEYKQDGLSVSQLSSAGEVTSTAIFRGAFPTTVGAIEFDQAGGALAVFDVTFDYDDFVMNDKDGDIILSNLDIDVGADGRFKGVSVKGLASVQLNITQ